MIEIHEKGKLLYHSKSAEDERRRSSEREARFLRISGIASLLISVLILVALLLSWILGLTRTLDRVIAILLFAVFFSFGILDFVALKARSVAMGFRVYEHCISFPARKSMFSPFVEKTIPFDEIEEVYPNVNQNLDYLTLLLLEGKKIRIPKAFIHDIEIVEKILEGRVKVVRDKDLSA